MDKGFGGKIKNQLLVFHSFSSGFARLEDIIQAQFSASLKLA
jgi:hypothetical protein